MKEKLSQITSELDSEKSFNLYDKIHRQNLKKEKIRYISLLKKINELEIRIKNIEEFYQISVADNDNSIINDLVIEIKNISNDIEKIEYQLMFSKSADNNSAYLDIQSGSGGIEAQDWAGMLLRMYLRFGDRHKFQVQLIDISPGEVSGIKNATIKYNGNFAYGWLRTESGIHRLVRKSPYDANHKRHTSFASIFVYPDIGDEIDIVIDPTDLRIDTYRAQGAGGQHVNKTDSAVRIKHNPTGIIVQCQNERSQHQNRAQAMNQLRAKLFEIETQKQKEAFSKLTAPKLDITWGNQIRSYILDDSRIKDLRTNLESRNVKSILDGNIDLFIKGILKSNNSY